MNPTQKLSPTSGARITAAGKGLLFHMYRSSVTACIPSIDVHGGITLKHGRVLHQKVQRAATLLAIEHDDDISGHSRSPRSMIDKEDLSAPGLYLGSDLRSDPGPVV